MSTTRVSFILFWMTIIGLSLRVHAQEGPTSFDTPRALETGPWSVGISLALTQSRHSGGRFVFGADYPDLVTKEVTRSGTGTGFQTGLAIDFAIGRVFSIGWRTVFDRRPGRFGVIRVCDCDGQTVEYTDSTEITYDLVTSELLLSVELLRISPASNVSIEAGVSVGNVIGSSRTMRTGSPEPHGTAPRVDEAVPLASNWRLSAMGGIVTSLSVGERIDLRPGLLIDVGITDVTKTEAWRIDSILLQLNVLFRL